MKLSFKEFIETQFLDKQATVSYHGQQDAQDTQVTNFPDLQTYKQYKMQMDPETTTNWTDMQWLIQYHFDRSHAQRRMKSTKPNQVTPTNLPSTK